MYSCKSCGAMLRYDISACKLKCDHCDATFDASDFSDLSSSGSEYESHIFKCSCCGGEIYTQDNDLTGRCGYCGRTEIFKKRVENMKKPGWIAPFTVDSDFCKSLYREAARKAIFAPKELKDPEYIDSIKGIYMPYWMYSCMTHKNICLKGIKSGSMTKEKDNVHFKIIEVDTEFDAEFLAIMGDASTWYLNEISTNIKPYRMLPSEKGLQRFNPAFMCGFYGETADGEKPSKYETKKLDDQASKRAREYVYKTGNQRMGLEKGMEQAERLSASRVELGLFPVWFLSYNKGNRVSYSTINGQTGKMSVEFPVDIKKFLLGILGSTALLFFILNLFWVMRPEYVALVAAIGAMWGIRFANRDIREISRKEASIAVGEKKVNVTRYDQIKINANPIPYIVLVLLVLAENAGFVDRHPFGLMVVLPIIMTMWTVIRGSVDVWRDIKLSQYSLKSSGVRLFPGYLFAYMSMIIALIVQFVRPVSDYMYFGVGFACMIMTLISLLSLIVGYNRMATRKMPQFSHEGGIDYAK